MNAYTIWKETQDALRLYGADDLLSIKASMNAAYQHLAGLRSWLQLRRKVTIDFAGHDSNDSMLLPGDCAGVDAIYDFDLGHQYMASERSAAEHSDEYGDDRNYRWFYTDAETDALAILTDVTLAQSANVFSCTGWLAAYINEYVQIGNELGIYKLTAANTISPRYYGPQLNGSPTDLMQVRPAGTKRFSIVDYDGVFVAAGKVNVYYWAYPTPLYLPNQPILLPDYVPLKLLTLIDIIGTKDRKEAIADRWRIEFDKAYALMESLNPDFQAPNVPLDRYGDRRSWTGK